MRQSATSRYFPWFRPTLAVSYRLSISLSYLPRCLFESRIIQRPRFSVPFYGRHSPASACREERGSRLDLQQVNVAPAQKNLCYAWDDVLAVPETQLGEPEELWDSHRRALSFNGNLICRLAEPGRAHAPAPERGGIHLFFPCAPSAISLPLTSGRARLSGDCCAVSMSAGSIRWRRWPARVRWPDNRFSGWPIGSADRACLSSWTTQSQARQANVHHAGGEDPAWPDCIRTRTACRHDATGVRRTRVAADAQHAAQAS